MRRLVSATCGLAILAVSPVFAAETWTIDPSHTQVTFSIGHFGFSTVHGMFRDVEGVVYLDEANPANSYVNFTVHADSVDTNWEARDEHIRNADFLHVDEHPTITFASTEVETSGPDTATVIGDLTLLGVTRPASFEVTLNKLGESPVTQQKTAGFTAEGTIDRTEWGMDTYAPAVGAEVTLVINTEVSPTS